MLLTDKQLVGFVNSQISLEGHVQGKENATIGQKSNISELEGSNPFKNSGVFVDNLTLLKVELAARILSRHFDERLISESRMVEIFLELEKPFKGVAKELRMLKSI